MYTLFGFFKEQRDVNCERMIHKHADKFILHGCESCEAIEDDHAVFDCVRMRNESTHDVECFLRRCISVFCVVFEFLIDKCYVGKLSRQQAMPGSFGQLDFLGLGPWENYADRCSGALFGRYQQSVAEQYHRGYVRTQESGTHTGLRYFRILDAAGNGLEVASALDFSASALPYSLEQLDVVSADGTAAFRHPEELKASGNTYVHVDAAQMGVGGINSWGTLPLDAYRLPARPREFRFLLRPVLNL